MTSERKHNRFQFIVYFLSLIAAFILGVKQNHFSVLLVQCLSNAHKKKYVTTMQTIIPISQSIVIVMFASKQNVYNSSMYVQADIY